MSKAVIAALLERFPDAVYQPYVGVGGDACAFVQKDLKLPDAAHGITGKLHQFVGVIQRRGVVALLQVVAVLPPVEQDEAGGACLMREQEPNPVRDSCRR